VAGSQDTEEIEPEVEPKAESCIASQISPREIKNFEFPARISSFVISPFSYKLRDSDECKAKGSYTAKIIQKTNEGLFAKTPISQFKKYFTFDDDSLTFKILLAVLRQERPEFQVQITLDLTDKKGKIISSASSSFFVKLKLIDGKNQ
jgi:hypothetical protein